MTEPVVRMARPDSWRREFIARHRGRCHYCNRPGAQDVGPDDRPWHIDHMKALARGGLDEEENLTLACKRCNLAKGFSPSFSSRPSPVQPSGYLTIGGLPSSSLTASWSFIVRRWTSMAGKIRPGGSTVRITRLYA